MATINLNSELNGIEISFESKPKSEILAELKENGFRWHHVKGIWYAKNTPERLELANRIADRVLEITVVGHTTTEKSVVAYLMEHPDEMESVLEDLYDDYMEQLEEDFLKDLKESDLVGFQNRDREIGIWGN